MCKNNLSLRLLHEIISAGLNLQSFIYLFIYHTTYVIFKIFNIYLFLNIKIFYGIYGNANSVMTSIGGMAEQMSTRFV